MAVNVTYNNPKMYECLPTDLNTYLLPVGRASFPNLFKAKPVMGDGEDKFSLSLIMPEACRPGLVVLDRYIKKLANEKWSPEKAKKIKHPILNNKEKSKDTALAEDFPYLIRMSTKFRPMVVFGNLVDRCEEDQEHEVYAGRWVRVSARLWAWERSSGFGVSLGLSSVQLLDHDDAISGGRGDPVKEFRGFATNDGPGQRSGGGNGKSEDKDGDFGLFG